MIGRKVRIVGNMAQGIRHFAYYGETGVVDGKRTAVLLRGEVKPVSAYYVTIDRARWLVAVEDLEVVE